jgi:chemotaxis protein CheC
MHTAQTLVSRMLSRPAEQFQELEISALCEVSNILTGSYLTALAMLTGYRITASPPADACDMLGALLDGTLAIAAGNSDEVLLIESEFVLDGGALGIQLLFIPGPGGLADLFKTLGVAQ